MTIEQCLKVVEMFISLFKVLVWPMALVIIIIYFRDSLKKFFENLSELTFKAGGLEASAKRRQFEAAALLGAAMEKQSREVPSDQIIPAEDRVRQIADVVSRASTPNVAPRITGASVLWVDDRPNNNLFERRSMEALGIGFTISTSTEDALEKIRMNNYDVIISDMGRPPDPLVGYTLLEKLRSSGNKMPFFIYAGSNAPEHKAEALKKGAQGSTNNPYELFQLVINALIKS